MSEERDYWRKGRSGISRRRFIRNSSIAGAGLASLTLLACGRGEAPSTNTAVTPEVSQPKRGGILTHQNGFETQGRGFDPHVQPTTPARTISHIYQSLLGYDIRTYDLLPELAQRWQQPSQLEYLFTLQPGVKFHNKPPANGRDMTIEDVVFSLNRIRTNEARFLSRSLLEWVDKIEAVDKTTVKFTMKEPDAAFLNNLAAPTMVIMAPEVVEKANRFGTAEEAVGTGPFVLKSAEDGVGAEYERHPSYWKPGQPYLDAFRTRHFATDDLAYAAFTAGQLDVTIVPGTEVKNYSAKQGANYKPDWFKDEGVLPATANTRVKPFDDARVTKALKLLIDHEEFITAYVEQLHGAGRNGSIFGAALEQWDLSHEEYYNYLEWRKPKDAAVREAMSLLSAASYSKEKPLDFELSGGSTVPSERATELLHAQWIRLGQGVVTPQVKIVDQAAFNAVLANKSFAFAVYGQSGAAVEPSVWLNQIYRTGASRNYGSFSDAKVDSLIDKQRVIFDAQQRKATIREIVVYMIENFPGTTPTGRLFLSAAKPHVRGFGPEWYVTGRQYENVWLDV